MLRFKRAGRWVLIAALSTATTGCQNGFSVPMWNPFAKSTATVPQPSSPSFGTPQEDSWAKKFGDTLTKPFKSASTPPAKKPPTTEKKNDPIALATKTSPPDAELYVSLAKLQERSGNTSGAIEEYNKALDVDSKSLPAMLGLARLYDRQGRYDDALKLYRTAVELHPENATVANDYGLCLARSGNIKESARLLRKAVTLDPERVLYRNNLATVLVELDRADEAYQTLVPAHGESVAHYNVGFLLNKRETEAAKTAAYEHFLAASKLNPNFKEAQQWLTVLKQYEPKGLVTASPVVVAKNVETEAPIATPVPRVETPDATMPRPVGVPTVPKAPTPYPTTSTPGVTPELPVISTEPTAAPISTPVPARAVSLPTVVEPAPTKSEPAASESTGPQLNLNPQSRMIPAAPAKVPAAVPPLPEQISSLGAPSPAAPAGTASKPNEVKSAARYPASRF